ncbi:hypothetical protein AB0J71_23955 [Nonomuraea sp. NPDC049637]|uniref:hypothetical protein n=2 Tax=Nonomuraea TaxID=83681 RepID=UPI00341D74F3
MAHPPKDSFVVAERLRMDLAERFLRPVPLPVREFSSDFGDRSDVDLTPPPGTVVVYFARDTTVLDRLSRAFEAADLTVLAELRRELDGRRSITPSKNFDLLQLVRQSDCVFDIRYGGRTLASNKILPDAELLGSVSISWTGGELDDNLFSVVEYHKREEAGPHLQYVAYRRPPYLTDMERSMVSRIPSAISEIHLGVVTPDETRTAREVCAIVEKAAKDAAKTRTCGPDLTLLAQLEEEIRNGTISPEASVRELVRARLELMTRTLQQ